MEKRVFLAIFLCFIVVWVWQAYIAPKPSPPTIATTTPPNGPAVAGAPTPGAPDPGAAPAAADPPTAAPLVADAAARDIVVETDSIRAVISTAGAALKSWKLKKYQDDQRQPLELVPQDIPAGTYASPSRSRPTTRQSPQTLSRALFKPSADGLSLGSAAGHPDFQYQDASGLNARKTFYFQPDGRPYVVNVEAAIDVGGAPQAGHHRLGTRARARLQPRGIAGTSGPRDSIPQRQSRAVDRRRSQRTGHATKDSCDICGVEEHYFLSGALPGTQTVKVDYQPVIAAGARQRGGQSPRRSSPTACACRPPAMARRPAVFHRAEGFRCPEGRRSAARRARSTSACSRGSSCRCCRR